MQNTKSPNSFMTVLPLSKVGIDGFRCLRSLELEGLGRINILIGGNNSGKTSVLEALAILCRPYNPEEWISMIRRRDFGGLDETIIQSMRWCFTQTAGLSDPDQLMEAACELSCMGNFPLRSLRAQYAEFIGEPSQYEIPEQYKEDFHKRIELLGKNIRGCELIYFVDFPDFDRFPKPAGEMSLDPDIPPSIKLWEKLLLQSRKQFRSPKISSETLTPYSYQINARQVRAYSWQIFQENSTSVLELLRDFDADVENIDIASFHGDRPAIYIKHKKLGVAPLSIFGNAMRRTVLLATTLLSLKGGGVLLIDEVEAGIHTGMLGRVFEWLVKSAGALDVQVFVTTHSLEALDAMVAARPLLNEDDIVTFHLSQTPERTVGKRLYGDLLRRLRFERGLDVR